MLFLLLPSLLLAQENMEAPKFALVIGNSAYTGITQLNNPVNDAGDIANVLEGFGFTVEKVLNGSLEQMENAIMQMKNRLSISKDSMGFLFYAGHGVQSNGENYLLPVDSNIPGESYLRQRAVSVHTMLDELNNAGNLLNIVILDACRDNPYSWRRSGSRGLAVVGNQPADSIVVYATSAGSTADDGQGRNGLFTEHLLNNMKDPGVDVNEIFRRTMGDVARASDNRQRPAVYNQFPGLAYLDRAPVLSGGTSASETVAQASAVVKPDTLPAQGDIKPGGKLRENDSPDSRLATLGASVGSAFSTPMFIGTIRGTIAPLPNSFLELGMDFGLGSNHENAGYFSLYPYAHYNFFMPFSGSGRQIKGGWYAGMGAGYMISRYTFIENTNEYKYLAGESTTFNYIAGDIIAGVSIADIIDISYTLRTNFKSVGIKFSVGYTRRFRLE